VRKNSIYKTTTNLVIQTSHLILQITRLRQFPLTYQPALEVPRKKPSISFASSMNPLLLTLLLIPKKNREFAIYARERGPSDHIFTS
jgi:hypothetical protein